METLLDSGGLRATDDTLQWVSLDVYSDPEFLNLENMREDDEILISNLSDQELHQIAFGRHGLLPPGKVNNSVT